MLSAAAQRNSPMVDSLQSNLNMFSPPGHPNLQGIQTSRLDSLAQSSEYAAQQLIAGPASMAMQERSPSLKSPVRVRHRSYDNVNPKTKERQRRQSEATDDVNSGTSGLVRRRISRACDQCNQLRTKCDGKNPCAHCVGRFVVCHTACLSG